MSSRKLSILIFKPLVWLDSKSNLSLFTPSGSEADALSTRPSNWFFTGHVVHRKLMCPIFKLWCCYKSALAAPEVFNLLATVHDNWPSQTGRKTTDCRKVAAMQTDCEANSPPRQLTAKTRGSKNHFAPYRFSNNCLLNDRVNLVATSHLIASHIVVHLMIFNHPTNAQHSCCEPWPPFPEVRKTFCINRKYDV